MSCKKEIKITELNSGYDNHIIKINISSNLFNRLKQYAEENNMPIKTAAFQCLFEGMWALTDMRDYQLEVSLSVGNTQKGAENDLLC